MSTNPIDIVIAYQDAWTNGDFDNAAKLLAPDFQFQGAGNQIDSADAMIAMLKQFTTNLSKGWHRIATTARNNEVLVIYNLMMLDGTPSATADYFTVANGRIQRELLVFDLAPYEAAAKAAK